MLFVLTTLAGSYNNLQIGEQTMVYEATQTRVTIIFASDESWNVLWLPWQSAMELLKQFEDWYLLLRLLAY
jgi:hypothetical protein